MEDTQCYLHVKSRKFHSVTVVSSTGSSLLWLFVNKFSRSSRPVTDLRLFRYFKPCILISEVDIGDQHSLI